MTYAILLALHALMTGVVIGLWLSMARLRAHIRSELQEARLCCDEYSEAVRLYQYGAFDEAVEMSRRWRERVGA